MMTKAITAYLVKITDICELDDSTVIITKWVKSEELPTGNIEILEKRILSENWVWQNEIYTLDGITKEPYAMTNDYRVK